LEKEIEELKNDKNIDQMSKNDKNIDKISNPVAWMDKNGYVYGKHETRPIEADIPLYTHTQSHPIEPVAMRYDFDGYGYKYIDSGSGSDWQTREKGELLYTKPFFQQKPVAMMVKIDGFDKPEFTTTCSSDALKHPNYTALYDHPPIAWAELEAGESIPLYTHPTKELDEQFKKGFEAGKEEGWKAHKFHHPTDTIPYKDLHQVVKNVLAQPMRELTDANRYQWLRNEFANGRETYLAEGIPNGEQLDKYIDEQLKKASEMTDRESAIYATGYWNGIQKAKEKNETLDTRSYLIGRYDGHPSKNNEAYEKGFIDGMQKQMQSRVQQMVEGYAQLRELSDEEIDNIFGISALNTTVTLTTEQCYWIVDAILKKVSEK